MKADKMTKDADMENKDYEAEEIRQYQMLLSEVSRLIVNYPFVLDELRDAIRESASMMISNSPEAISNFHKLAEEVDAFLLACKTGEVDPKRLINEEEDS